MDLISLNRAQLIHKSNTQNATRGPTLLVSAIHIAAAGFGKVKKKKNVLKCVQVVPCVLHNPAVRKEPFPIIDFIAFEDGFTPSGFWKHMVYRVTHTSLTHSHPLLLPDTVARWLTQTRAIETALERHTHSISRSIMHTNAGMHC